jgi:excisionase family DNA binding protein
VRYQRIQTVAKDYDLPIRTIREYCITKRIRASKVGKHWLIPAGEMDKLIRKGMNKRDK